jgi:hypothetical protein
VNRRDELHRAVVGTEPLTLPLIPLRLCEIGAERLAAQGVGVALISSPESRSLLSGSGPLAGLVEDLQFSLGEGPCLDAFNDGAPAMAPDLNDGGLSRWPAFAPAALEAGVRAVFAFPLRVGAARFGVLDIVRTNTGTLAVDEVADALALADIATETVLRIQADCADDYVADGLGDIGAERVVLHQATGMVSAQAEIAIPEALARLRAYAYTSDRRMYDVASDVVARRLSFQP